jgi:vacuolar protein sorting-associated protein IST1
MDNSDGKVNERVVKKLSVEPPKQELVQGYLEEIARAYGVDWPRRGKVTPPPDLIDDLEDDGDDSSPSGGQKILAEPLATGRKLSKGEEELNKATPPQGFGGPKSPVTVTPPRRTTENVHPKVTLGSVELKPNKKMEAVASRKEPDGAVPDISDLERRFAALKKR